jgi:hypothetical protein
MAIMRLEELGQLKNPMASSGIKPATFRLVAQWLNQLRYRVPLLNGERLGEQKIFMHNFFKKYLNMDKE